MKKVILICFALFVAVGTFAGCNGSDPEVIEQTMTPEEIAAEDEAYEKEMEEADQPLGSG